MAVRLRCPRSVDAGHTLVKGVDAVLGARVRAVLSLGMVLGLGAVGTLAAWSTSATTTSGDFTTGVIDIQLNNTGGDTPAAAYTIFSPSATVTPGGSVAALLPVQNKGNLTFDYTTTAAGVGAVGQAMQLTARYGAGVSVVNNACSGGTAIPSSPTSLATPQSIGGTRRLAATSGTETICLQFTLPLTTTGVTSGQAGSVLFTFTATAVPT